MKTISHTYRDGMTNEWSLWETKVADAPILMIFPALGVRASYYDGLANAFHQAGWHVCSADYRGMGKSSVRASRKQDFGYDTLVQDTLEALNTLKSSFPASPLYLLGHSLGGQIGSILAAREPELMSGLILAASCLVDPNGWPKGQQFRTRLAVHVFPPLAKLIGYFPGKQVGFGGREAKTLMRDWGHSGRTGRYELAHSDQQDEARLAQLKLKTLALTFEGDDFCPAQASQHLYGKFHPDSAITHRHLTSREMDPKGLNHFKWTRFPEVIVQEVNQWRN
ncbi:MAG: alpha/beta fold hydrolase [Bacteroidota bacterium]